MNKIAYFSNTDFSLHNFRMGLMKEMKARGFFVIAVGSSSEERFKESIEKEGISFFDLPLKRTVDWRGGDFLYILRVFNLCRRERINFCHNFTSKPNTFGVLGQRMAGVENIYCTVNGLGYAFQEEKSFIRKIVVFLYKISFRFCKKVIFQNKQDMKDLLREGCLNKEKCVLIESSGVDINYFNKKEALKEKLPRKKEEGEKIVSMISRMLYEKGVGEFAEVAESLKGKATFLLVGPVDENPSAVPLREIRKWEERGNIEYLGNSSNVREILYLSDIIVLPSKYREGVPKIILEAGSMERAVVTTDIPGCREVVKDGESGILVTPGNKEELAKAIKFLLENDEDRERYGKRGREIIEERFEEKKIIKKTVETYGL